MLAWWRRKSHPHSFQSTRCSWKKTAAPHGRSTPPSRCRSGTAAGPPSWQRDLPREWQRGGGPGAPTSPAPPEPQPRAERREPQAFYGGILHSPPCRAPALGIMLLEGKGEGPLLPQTARQTQPFVVAWPPHYDPEPGSPPYISQRLCCLAEPWHPLIPGCSLPSAPCLLARHPPCPVPTAWPPCSSPCAFWGGGGPCSPVSSGGALSGTQVSYYSLLEGYYRLTHLENYSFFRPFRNFNELF